MSAAETVHASCVIVGEAGLLIRGASGSGKSSLARDVVFRAGHAGLFARLVSDDRTHVAARHGRLVAAPVEPLGGCVEIRGVGIIRQPFEPAAVIRLVLDLGESPPRYPDAEDRNTVVCGVMIPRIRIPAGAVSADIVIGRLRGICDTVVTL